MHIQTDGLAIAKMTLDKQNNPTFNQVQFLPTGDPTDSPQLIRQAAQSLKLSKEPWTLVLDNSAYQLLLVDLPDLPDEDVEDALKLRVRDLISYSIDDAQVDVFRLPDNAYRGRMKMAYVTVAEKAPLQGLADSFGQSGLKLQSIDIADLALRNLVTLVSQDINTGVLYMQNDNSFINLCHNQYLVLNRRLENGLSSFPDDPDSDGFKIQLDSLTLEIQRSFDYYESQLGLGNISELKIVSNSRLPIQIVEGLDKAFNTRVSDLKYADHFTVNADIEPSNLARCTLAMGAALREIERPGLGG